MNELVDKFNSFQNLYKWIGLIVCAMVFFTIFWFLFWTPLQDDISRSASTLKALENQRVSLEEVKRNRTELDVSLRKLEAQLLIAQEKLPQNAEIPSLLQRIHNQAKTAGLDIRKFGREKDQVKDFYVEIPVQMQMSGTYDELANFFHYIGRMTRIVNVRELALSREKGGLNSDGTLDVTALATTFRYKSTQEMSAKGARRGPRRR